jgi:hypothetical protein
MKNFTTGLYTGNGPCVLMDAPTPPPLVVSPLSMAPLPLAFLLPLAELMLKVVVAPLGATIPIVIET